MSWLEWSAVLTKEVRPALCYVMVAIKCAAGFYRFVSQTLFWPHKSAQQFCDVPGECASHALLPPPRSGDGYGPRYSLRARTVWRLRVLGVRATILVSTLAALGRARARHRRSLRHTHRRPRHARTAQSPRNRAGARPARRTADRVSGSVVTLG